MPTRKNHQFSNISEFILGRKLGDGAYAVVRKAIHIASESTFAIKIIELSSLGENDYENVEKELDIHSSIHHEAIIGLVDFFQDDEKVYLVLEFAEKGNLFKFMHQNLTPDPEMMGKMWAQTVSAIEYLHTKDIIMRDLKPENILVTKDFNVKICDFGWAARIDDVEYRRLKAGTYIYMSPESLMGKLQSFQTDVWSLGVLLFEMHHNREPFSCGVSCQEQLFFIRQQQVYFKDDVDPRVKVLVSGSLIEDKKKRFQLKDLVQSAYVKEYLTKQVDPENSRKKSALDFLSNRNKITKPKLAPKAPLKGFISKAPTKHYNSGTKFMKKNASMMHMHERKSPSRVLKNNLQRKKTINLNDFVAKKISKGVQGQVMSNAPVQGVVRHNRTMEAFGVKKQGLGSILDQNPKPAKRYYKMNVSESMMTLNRLQSNSTFTKYETLEKTKKKLQHPQPEITNKTGPKSNVLLSQTSTKEFGSKPNIISLSKLTAPKEEAKHVVVSPSQQNIVNNQESQKINRSNKVIIQNQGQSNSNQKVFLKRSNTTLIKPMFAPGFTHKRRNIDIFKHRKNQSLNESLFDKIGFGKITKSHAHTQGDSSTRKLPEKTQIQKSILQSSKMEERPKESQVVPTPILKKSSSKMHINLNSYKIKKATDLQSSQKTENILGSGKKTETKRVPTRMQVRLKSETFDQNTLKVRGHVEEDITGENPNTMRTRDSSANLSKQNVEKDRARAQTQGTFLYKKPREKTEPFEHVLAKKTSVRKIKLNEYFGKK
jgi:serine/threonine protein kinase